MHNDSANVKLYNDDHNLNASMRRSLQVVYDKGNE